jgi:hypothetical protein
MMNNAAVSAAGDDRDEQYRRANGASGPGKPLGNEKPSFHSR